MVTTRPPLLSFQRAPARFDVLFRRPLAHRELDAMSVLRSAASSALAFSPRYVSTGSAPISANGGAITSGKSDARSTGCFARVDAPRWR